MHEVFKDLEYDLIKVTKTLRNIPIADRNRGNMTLYKTMNKGLYLGKVARLYVDSLFPVAKTLYVEYYF